MDKNNLIDLYRDLQQVSCQKLEPHPDPDYGMTECSDRYPFEPYNWCPLCRALHKLNEIIEK
jgi:hypothetical protein